MFSENFTTAPRSLVHFIISIGAVQLMLCLSARGFLFGIAHGDARWVGGIARL
jgi:hypothetical protein